METPPTPKPRKLPNSYENVRRPVPLPRNKETTEGLSTQTVEDSIILRNKSMLIQDTKLINTTIVPQKSTESKSIVKQIQDNIFNNTRQNKQKSLKSVSDPKSKSSNFLSKSKKRKNKNILTVPQHERCVSMPITDTKLFDSIQFNSPINEQVQYDHVRVMTHQSSSSTTTDSPNISLSSDVDINSTLSLMPTNSSSNSSSSFVLEGASKIMTIENNAEENQLYESLFGSSNSWALYDSVPLTDSDNNVDNDTLARVSGVQTRSDQTDHCALKPERPSQSLMIEFDPLSRNSLSSIAQSPLNMSLLESLSVKDNANSIYNDTESEYDFYWDDSIGYLSPPTPPERLDSLLLNKEKLGGKSKPENKSKEENKDKLFNNAQSKWFVDGDGEKHVPTVEKSTDTNRNLKVGSLFSNMFKLVPDSASYLKKMIDSSANSCVPNKLLFRKTSSNYYKGKMVRFLPGGIEEMLKKYSMRPCSLADYKLAFYQDKSDVKDVYNLKNFYSVQIILSHKFNYDGELHCFQINFSSLGTFNLNRGSIIFGCENESERNCWIKHIVESFTESFPINYVTQLTRFGWCYLKEGVSGIWDTAWLLLSKRKLFYFSSQDGNVHSVDLRKARCVGILKKYLLDIISDHVTPFTSKLGISSFTNTSLQSVHTQTVLKESTERKATDSGHYILLDQQDLTLYLRMVAGRETKIWHRILRAVATNNGSSIHHQQLTKDNVPTIVDKCINFIYTQGSLSVGIYRKAGSNVLVSQLLNDFRSDAWAVQLASRTHSEHDVATALKRFFRDLPDSLLTAELHPMFCAVAGSLDKKEKVKRYKNLITNLNVISQNTLHRLVAHLHFIQSLSDENCMTALNLATVWGPTLLSSPQSAGDANMMQDEAKVVYDLIDLYMLIYEPSKSDLDREQKMLSVLKQCQQVTNPIQKRSGDLHVWIYLLEKSAGNPVNVVLNPGRTCSDVCLELSTKVGKEYHLLTIEEVICGDSMRRPLHHTESLLDVVLRWGYWDEKDRCDNYLILKENYILIDAAKTVVPKKLISLSMELRFANEKAKSFTLCTVEYSDGKLICFKEKTNPTLLGTWKVSELRWYLGHELKRNPQSKWSITFIDKNKTLRPKDKPWFGCTIAGCLKEEQLSLMGAFLQAEYSDNLVAEPRLIIT